MLVVVTSSINFLFKSLPTVTAPVEVVPIDTVPAPLASIVKFSSVPEETAEIATPPAAAADLTLTHVADVAVDASTTNAGLVAPFNPAESAAALAEVIVDVPVTVSLPVIATVPVANLIPVRAAISIYPALAELNDVAASLNNNFLVVPTNTSAATVALIVRESEAASPNVVLPVAVILTKGTVVVVRVVYPSLSVVIIAVGITQLRGDLLVIL
jgi:hypothetical protein